MSVASSVALPEAPAVRTARIVPNRLALLFAVILATSVAAFALSLISYLRPIGDGDSLPGYAAIEPIRGFVWAFFVAAGVQLIVGACAAALAGWILAPARGARWATVGGSLIWLGAAVYGVGVGGFATVYYFASDKSTLDPATATALIDRINHDTSHILAIPIAGAALIGLGTLVLAVGLWRARTVPRWVILVGAASSVATFLLPPSTAAGVVVEGASSITTIAIGWYAWRRHAVNAGAVPVTF